MNNSSSDILLQSSESSFPSLSSSSSSGSILDSLKNISVVTWLLIIFILAFLGFNIFAYLAQGTQDVTNFFSPVLKTLFGTTVAVTGEAIDTAAEGAKVVVGGTAGAIEGGLTAIQEITPNQAHTSTGGTSLENQQKPKQMTAQQASLTRALNSTQPQQQQNQDYQANEASSSYDGTNGKSGWCYIGEDQGYRTCAEVSASDKCMSGEIFPSQEICMNPNMRY